MTSERAAGPGQPDEHFETAGETAKATAGAVTSAHMLRLAEELRATRELKEFLAKSGRDPVSRADAAWRPIRMSLLGLRARLEEARSLPPCPSKTKAELLAMWTAVSRLLGELQPCLFDNPIPGNETARRDAAKTIGTRIGGGAGE